MRSSHRIGPIGLRLEDRYFLGISRLDDVSEVVESSRESLDASLGAAIVKDKKGRGVVEHPVLLRVDQRKGYVPFALFATDVPHVDRRLAHHLRQNRLLLFLQQPIHENGLLSPRQDALRILKQFDSIVLSEEGTAQRQC